MLVIPYVVWFCRQEAAHSPNCPILVAKQVLDHSRCFACVSSWRILNSGKGFNCVVACMNLFELYQFTVFRGEKRRGTAVKSAMVVILFSQSVNYSLGCMLNDEEKVQRCVTQRFCGLHPSNPWCNLTIRRENWWVLLTSWH